MLKLHSKRVGKMLKLHSKRVEKMLKLHLKRVGKMLKLHSKRVGNSGRDVRMRRDRKIVEKMHKARDVFSADGADNVKKDTLVPIVILQFSTRFVFSFSFHVGLTERIERIPVQLDL